MSWLQDLSAGFATGGAGSLLGLLGTGLTKWAEVRDRRDQRRHDLAVLDREIKVAAAEATRAAAADKLAAETDQMHVEATLMAASYRADALPAITAETPPVLVWVEAARRVWRPALTMLLLALTWWLAADNDDPSLVDDIIHGVLFATTAAVTWWFGSRASAAAPSCQRTTSNPLSGGIPAFGPVRQRK